MTQLGVGIGSLNDNLAKVGKRLKSEWIVDLCQRANVGIEDLEEAAIEAAPILPQRRPQRRRR